MRPSRLQRSPSEQFSLLLLLFIHSLALDHSVGHKKFVLHNMLWTVVTGEWPPFACSYWLEAILVAMSTCCLLRGLSPRLPDATALVALFLPLPFGEISLLLLLFLREPFLSFAFTQKNKETFSLLEL